MTTTQPSFGVRNILVEVLIEAPLEHVWRTMVVETSAWWHSDFYSGPAPEGFHIEPELGGRMYEDWGEGNGLVWGTVAGLRAPTFLQVVGDTSKDWGGPSRNIMAWRLDREGETTRLRLEHSIFGNISKETEESLRSGWDFLIGGCFKRFAETGERPSPAVRAPGCETAG
jgi:uncharacterized protein YndB with AHSA1/START domain